MIQLSNLQTFTNLPVLEQPWRFGVADWLMSPTWGGAINHHMRVVSRDVDEQGQRWYLIFDTTLTRGKADYEYVRADVLEREASVYRHPDPLHIQGILHRAERLRGLPYSIPKRQDCESLQGWIETGQDQHRRSSQVWAYTATVVGALLLACVTSES